jgi:uncharacterized repeat protein (TIGR03809 family)
LPNQQIHVVYLKAPIPRVFSVIFMSERQTGPYDDIARRWLALVERRQEHFLDLCDSGRWRHYYTHAEFLDEMRKVLHVRDRWAAIAGVAVSDDAPDEDFVPREVKFWSPRRAEMPAELPVAQWQNGANGA